MKRNRIVSGVAAGVIAAGLGIGLAGFATGCKTGGCPCGMMKKETKQVNNADFYKDGKFDAAKAKQAYYDLMKKFKVPVYADLVRTDGPFWAVDFKRGQFATFGMGGVFWCNEAAEGYFGHEIYLLPGQNIPEHKHLPTADKAGNKVRCKVESWQVRHGSVYGFSEVGEPNLDKFPEAKAMLDKEQAKFLKSVHVEKWVADGVVRKLPAPETWHFMQGGPDGAIVTEYATFHDSAGLRFSVPGTEL